MQNILNMHTEYARNCKMRKTWRMSMALTLAGSLPLDWKSLNAPAK
jgi:hypothetical protein